jgi:endonuclease YncB( thermonuclease family)
MQVKCICTERNKMDYSYKCKIVKVIDGDTADIDIDLGFDVWLKNQRVRFMGIDTQSLEHRTKKKKYLVC